ncbi:hypothetical protein CNMCM8980_010337 [Aspergillus fumigatiaffinis]|uniref:N(6)-L-threonylcarbamoyladenine synthase n=1 Tax=Aspergillus fumigatiaffinis TaxID=340414 RepID=A0A8H4HG82_9EURO|nr:hypothetical protein CNMCM5878_008299 [Aspergillus fumigatiaffinis]KAF4244001.1 hypothetical protein CNMCM8980_010337 [Aspergillus fumigatiaffinis]KAF4245043.1 hypothetical protein CNMCM6805_006476 [Aspergillus fumigatiaffinis]
MRPKLSVVTSTAQSLTRPSLSLKSPGPFPRTPNSPVPLSPGGKRFSSIQTQSYGYTNSCKSKSILKKQPMASATSHAEKRIQFQGTPTVHCVTPIENPEEYYGTYTKLSKEERRWMTTRSTVGFPETACLLASAPGSDFGIVARNQIEGSLLSPLKRHGKSSTVGDYSTSLDSAHFCPPSSDDTSVAIVEKNDRSRDVSARIHFLENVTADTREYRGIHPILALESHQENLAKLVDKALRQLPRASEDGEDTSKRINLSDGSQRRKPDFVSATRGPGMRANLFTGLDTAKGLSVAWQIPFVGVHHMQAHLLTPRLVSAMIRAQHDNDTTTNAPITPEFPFLSILVSGGHSMLVESTSITDHTIMASTADIAIGESLDKAAREILPPSVLNEAKTTMYGKLLERFAFPNGSANWSSYCAPKSRGEELIKQPSPWGWTLTSPFANTRQLQFSFSFLPSMITKLMGAKKTAGENVSDEERVVLAREAMRVCFEHLGSRTIIALEELQQKVRNKGVPEVKTLVISGGVAANRFLMAVLRSFLDVRGFGHVEIVAPPPYLCTDNAAMIGWAGIEMFEAGFSTDLGSRALRKWALDSRAEDGGLLGADGWMMKQGDATVN